MHLKRIPRGTSTAESHPGSGGLAGGGSGLGDVKNVFMFF